MLMIKLSKKELQILHELECNARQSLSAIAKKCRTSKEAVNYHIKKFEKLGIIRGYFLLTDKSRLGLITWRVYIKQRRLDQELEQNMIEFLKSQPDIAGFGRTSGEMDFVLGISKKNEHEFGEFIEDLLNKFGKEIKWLQAHLFLDYVEYSREYLTGELKKSMRMISNKEKAKYDSIDLRILKELAKNARAPFSEVAGALGLSERIVRYRVRRMEREGIIIAYRCNLDYRKLGYDYYKLDLFLEDRAKIDKVRMFVNALPQTVYSEVTAYCSDVEFDIEVSGIQELLDTVQSIVKKFPKTISEFKYYSMIEFYR